MNSLGLPTVCSSNTKNSSADWRCNHGWADADLADLAAKFHSLPPRRGRSHLFTQKVPQYHIFGSVGRSAGEGLGRPAVVPPAGRGWGWMRAPAGALGGKEGGTLSPKAPRARAAGSEIGALPWGRRGLDREDSIPTGRWAAPVGREGGSGRGTPGRGTPAFRVAAQVAAGSVPPIYTKGAIAYYPWAGWPVCGGRVG